MARKDDERDVRLRPQKPPISRNEGAAWSKAFKLLMHFARTSQGGNRSGATKNGNASRVHNQRCAVRATYLKNKTAGQWKAHGRYLARESATFEEDAKAVGFDGAGEGIDIAGELEKWQAAGDERLWKFIISPEFGDRTHLERLTRDLVKRMESDLGTELEWIAVAHHNTQHPHVHIALRGLRDDGQSLHLSRDYVKHGIRGIAEDLCTRQLGYRTGLDAAEAERREITETRFTSLDRRLLRNAQSIETEHESPYFTVEKNPMQAGLNDTAQLHVQHAAARLIELHRMGLAEPAGPNTWRVRRDFQDVLRAMQRTTDRQKTLAAHGALMSDERLPIQMLDSRQLTSVEGRILVHGQDEFSGRNYLMLEGTDAKVHFIHYTPEMEEARSRGRLRTNVFVRLRKIFVEGEPMLDIDEFGNSETVLKNRGYFEQTAQRLIKRGIVPVEDGWGGWLGRYQAELRNTAVEIEQQRQKIDLRPVQQRDRDHSQGR